MHFVIHAEMPPNDAAVAAVACFPIGIAEHQHRVSARHVVGGCKKSAKVWLDAQQIKEMSRDHSRTHFVRLLPIQQDERHLVVLLNLRQ